MCFWIERFEVFIIVILFVYGLFDKIQIGCTLFMFFQQLSHISSERIEFHLADLIYLGWAPVNSGWTPGEVRVKTGWSWSENDYLSI